MHQQATWTPQRSSKRSRRVYKAKSVATRRRCCWTSDGRGACWSISQLPAACTGRIMPTAQQRRCGTHDGARCAPPAQPLTASRSLSTRALNATSPNRLSLRVTRGCTASCIPLATQSTPHSAMSSGRSVRGVCAVRKRQLVGVVSNAKAGCHTSSVSS